MNRKLFSCRKLLSYIELTFFYFVAPSVAERTGNEVISIDGKSMRGTREHGSKTIVHMVSAWAAENHIVPGQLKIGEKSNEITAIPKLLDLSVIKGCIATIDAMECQKEIVSAIAGKGNQGNL